MQTTTRCAVALQLASNNLTGGVRVNGTRADPRNVLCDLDHLQVLSLGNNSLSGIWPDDVGPLPTDQRIGEHGAAPPGSTRCRRRRRRGRRRACQLAAPRP